MTTEQQTLKLDEIRIDGGTQPRVKIDEDLIAEYRSEYDRGDAFPPVTVFFDGATYWLADGFHRYFAQKQRGLTTIEAELHTGTQRDAILFSVGANAAHGRRRTNGDKQKAVLTLLKDGKWSQWTNSEIARRCAVTHPTVQKYRSSLESFPSEQPHAGETRTPESAASRTYKTKHGTVATMKTAKIGRSPKRKFKPTGGIAKDAFSTRAPHSLQSRVPMKNVDLPLNNPRKAARCMISVYGEDYMRTLCDELNNLFKEG